MADLTDLQAAQTIKVVGASSSGIETNAVNATANGDLQSADLLNVSVVQTTINVTTSAVEAKVGGSNLTNRKMIIIQVQTGNMTYGFSSGSQPFTIPNGTTLTLALGPNISIWLRRTSGSGNVAVAELS